jgi:hypothetical protein
LLASDGTLKYNYSSYTLYAQIRLLGTRSNPQDGGNMGKIYCKKISCRIMFSFKMMAKMVEIKTPLKPNEDKRMLTGIRTSCFSWNNWQKKRNKTSRKRTTDNGKRGLTGEFKTNEISRKTKNNIKISKIKSLEVTTIREAIIKKSNRNNHSERSQIESIRIEQKIRNYEVTIGKRGGKRHEVKSRKQEKILRISHKEVEIQEILYNERSIKCMIKRINYIKALCNLNKKCKCIRRKLARINTKGKRLEKEKLKLEINGTNIPAQEETTKNREKLCKKERTRGTNTLGNKETKCRTTSKCKLGKQERRGEMNGEGNKTRRCYNKRIKQIKRIKLNFKILFKIDWKSRCSMQLKKNNTENKNGSEIENRGKHQKGANVTVRLDDGTGRSKEYG